MSNLRPSNKIFRNTFFLIILAELLSFLGYYYPSVNSLAFFIIVIVSLILSLYRLEYGLYILLAELFIGSFGYLFYFENGGLKISIRVALWLIIISVWLAKIITEWLKTKKLTIDFFKSGQLAPFIVLLIFVGWGLVNGLINGNSPSNLFFDFNNWLYFLLIFPIFTVWRDNGRLKIIKPIFLAAITWLSAKTIILVYIFTHNFYGLGLEIYDWMRADRLGEITQTTAGFSRIFMQSHIFILIGFFILLVYLLATIANRRLFVIPARLLTPKRSDGGQALKPKARPVKSLRDASVFNGASRNPEITSTNIFTAHPWIAGQARNDKERDPNSKPGMTLTATCCLLSIFLSAIIISFSRSFWLGLAAGGITVWLVAILKLRIKLKQFLIFNGLIILIIGFSLALTATAVKFPYPSAYGGFNPADLLSQRVTQITGEAGALSRWQLLLPLWQKIKTAPILGQGFGATVTYRSNDPRILATSPDGLYTTYSFEWGWLDIWLKLGLFGLLAYLFLFIKIIKDGLKITPFSKGGEGDLILSLITGLVVLAAVNIFSPYVNHPLGIGYIIMVMAIMEDLR